MLSIPRYSTIPRHIRCRCLPGLMLLSKRRLRYRYRSLPTPTPPKPSHRVPDERHQHLL